MSDASKKNFSRKLLLFASLFFIVFGGFLCFVSSSKETLDDKYVVNEVKEYKSNKLSLLEGEVTIYKDILYGRGGNFRISYYNWYNVSKNVSLLMDDSYLSIDDVISDSYEILDDVYVNDMRYTFSKKEIVTVEKIKLSRIKNKVSIDIPSNLSLKNNQIDIFVKLKNRNTGVKNEVCLDSYYSFTPSPSNNAYEKKGMQSYELYGNAYIKLR